LGNTGKSVEGGDIVPRRVIGFEDRERGFRLDAIGDVTVDEVVGIAMGKRDPPPAEICSCAGVRRVESLGLVQKKEVKRLSILVSVFEAVSNGRYSVFAARSSYTSMLRGVEESVGQEEGHNSAVDNGEPEFPKRVQKHNWPKIRESWDVVLRNEAHGAPLPFVWDDALFPKLMKGVMKMPPHPFRGSMDHSDGHSIRTGSRFFDSLVERLREFFEADRDIED
jgi:hypothetical protein